MINLGHYEESLKLAKAVLKESQKLRKRRHLIDALIAMADALIRLQRYDESLNVIEKGEYELTLLARDRPEEVPPRKADLMLHNGFNYLYKGEIDRALEYCQQCLILFEELGNKLDIAIILTNLGEIYQFKGDLDQALVHLEQSLALHEEFCNNLYV